jgi:hypothetical protein
MLGTLRFVCVNTHLFDGNAVSKSRLDIGEAVIVICRYKDFEYLECITTQGYGLVNEHCLRNDISSR